MSLNQSINIATSSMRNNQMALSVVSHNIANLNTDGYVRQRVDFSESRFSVRTNSVIEKIKAMNGAEVSALSGYIDNSTFKGMINSAGDASYYNTLANDLGAIEDVADDLGDNGLNALLNDFYTACANLEQFPTDLSMRQQYVMALQNVCDKFNYIEDRYTDIQEDKFDSISNDIVNINTLLSNLASANLAHVKNGQGSSTQTEINAILAELSNYADITYSQNGNGSYNLMIGGVTVVEGTEQLYEFQTKYDSAAAENPLSITLKSLKDDSVTINSGSLKADIDFLNGTNKTVGFLTVNDMKASIKSAEDAFKNALNEVQTFKDTEGGNQIYAAYITTKDGNLVLASTEPDPAHPDDPIVPKTPVDLLVYDDNNKLQVNSDVVSDPYKVAAARIDLSKFEPGEDWTQAIGNADNAGYMSAIQNEKICSYGTGTNNCTLSQFLINTAAKNGMDLASTEKKAEVYQGIADSRAEDYKNMTGVNLDEELADMIKYQRAFEASAAIFSAANNMMQTIIGMI